MIKPIYEPKGRAKEYGETALNIYTGCNHRCFYCFSPSVLRCDREKFHTVVEPRKDVVRATRHQLQKEQITGKMLHLCFSCDPYPAVVDTIPTREIILALKEYGNHVQILTKGGNRALRDFDLLDGEDWFGVTIAGTQQTISALNAEPGAAPIAERIASLKEAHGRGIKTWVSLEPALDTAAAYQLIQTGDFIDHFKIGKMNYEKSDIKWSEYGLGCERLCRIHKRNYYIKDDLRKLTACM